MPSLLLRTSMSAHILITELQRPKMGQDHRRLLALAAEAMRLSARGFHRVMRVSRTIADLAGSEAVGRVHVAEALSCRRQAPRN